MKGVIAIVLLVVAIPAPAVADQYSACWVEIRVNEIGQDIQVTVCRNAGNGELVEYASDDAIPQRLYPNTGTDAVSTCWYYTTAVTNWVFVARYADGSASLGYDGDGPGPGGPALDTGPLRRCTSEPVELPPPEAQAWDLISAYVHQRPQPDLNPIVGRGLAGLDTHVGVLPPLPFDDFLAAPGRFLEVRAEVAAVAIAWGDGSSDLYPATVFDGLTGYPDGIAQHLYETKTCSPPGSLPDCHPQLPGYPLSVAYQWVAEWRVNGGPWQQLDVAPTATTFDYTVSEIVSVLIETG